MIMEDQFREWDIPCLEVCHRTIEGRVDQRQREYESDGMKQSMSESESESESESKTEKKQTKRGDPRKKNMSRRVNRKSRSVRDGNRKEREIWQKETFLCGFLEHVFRFCLGFGFSELYFGFHDFLDFFRVLIFSIFL